MSGIKNMKTINVTKKDLDINDYAFRDAEESDYSRLIKEPCIVKHDGKVLAVYLVLSDKETETLRSIIKEVKCSPDRRSKGLIVNAVVFGYTPRKTLTRDYCSSAMMAHNNPKAHSIVCDFGKTLAKYYQRECSEIYQEHLETTKSKVKPNWVIEDTPFTSGIINKDSALRYHFDKGNFANVYSNMIALKHGVTGGYLAMPEYDIGLEVADNSVVLFDGQKILHGVTPIHKHTADAYRYTIVYYTLKKMWNCETPKEELDRIKKIKTQREKRRFGMLKGVIPKTI